MNKKRIFNLNFFIAGFTQLRKFGIIGTVIMILCSAAPVIRQALRYANAQKASKIFVSYVGSNYSNILLFMLFAPVLAFYGWNFLTQRNQSDFYHSLPFTRKCMYITRLLSIIAWQTIIVFSSCVSTLLVYKIYDNFFVVNYGSIIGMFFAMWCASMLCIAAISLSCSLMGNLFDNIFATFLILFFVRVLITVVTSTMSSVLPILINDKVNVLFDNSYNIVFGTLAHMFYGMGESLTSIVLSPASVIYTLVLSIIYFVLGNIAFAKRKSESAGRISSNRRIGCAMRFLMAFLICAISVNFYIKNDWNYHYYTGWAGSNFVTTILIAAVMSAFVVILHEFLNTRSFSNIKKYAIPPLFAAYAASGILYIGINSGIETTAAHAPFADDVEYVTIMPYFSNESNKKDYFSNMKGNIKITDYGIIDRVCAALSDNGSHIQKKSDFNEYINDIKGEAYVVKLKDGLLEKYRMVYMSYDDIEYISSHLSNEEGYRELYQNLPKNVTGFETREELLDDDREKLYEIICSEYSEYPISNLFKLNYFIYLRAKVNVNDVWYSMNLPIVRGMQEAYNFYYNGINRFSREKASYCLSKMDELIDSLCKSSNYFERENLASNRIVDFDVRLIEAKEDGNIRRATLSFGSILESENGYKFLEKLPKMSGVSEDKDYAANNVLVVISGKIYYKINEKNSVPDGEVDMADYVITLDGYEKIEDFKEFFDELVIY